MQVVSEGSRRAGIVGWLLLVALLAWIVSVVRMRGMDAGPGTDLGALISFLGIWVTMMAAMMLPAVVPVVGLFVRVHRSVRPVLFVGGYLVVWAAYGLAAYGLFRAARAYAPAFVSWRERGPWVAGAGLVVAGVYQVTPLKTACLRHCRSPLHLVMRAGRGRLAGVRLGVLHGGYCVGCCAGLMLGLFALGAMSLVWMSLVTVVILVEKVAPGGATFACGVAVALVGLGFWVAVAPATVPGLVQPPHAGMMRR
jgi:predicted metal-binding membrane protein